ncbi:MAG TPA: hypothetical protein VF933_28820, partial [Streptosporangiaceae bacterium]
MAVVIVRCIWRSDCVIQAAEPEDIGAARSMLLCPVKGLSGIDFSGAAGMAGRFLGVWGWCADQGLLELRTRQG